MNKEDRMDNLIKEILKEDVEDVHISNSEIEFEWRKLQGLEKCKKENRKSYKKIASIAAIITISFMMVNSFSSTESYSWKIFKQKNIHQKTEDIINIKDQSSSSELDDTNETINTLEKINIEDAHKFIDFNFKQLPYTLENSSIIGTNTLILNYVANNDKIEFIQSLENNESSNSVTFYNESNMESFTIGNTEYTFINTKNQISEIIWSSFGIKSNITFNYDLSKDECIDIIKSLK
ncbi:hypothetical protein IZY60_13825 [Lutibacter sp. B2]|nr:hypothetical protein [Lutibacter sp. B2]MBF8984620.1 hypothetical protein [Lutibacter sp. B2]